MKNYFRVIIMASTLLWVGCKEKPGELVEPMRYCIEESFKKELEFVTATKRTITEGIHLTGMVEANPDKVISFKSLYAGVVKETYFSLGQRVTRGQVLAEISSNEFGTLNADLVSTESQIKVADTKLASTKAMFADGLASQREIDEAQSELDILKAQRYRVSSARDLYSASQKGVFQVKAPATGIITAKNISPGAQISAESESPLFTISNLDDVWVMANVYASNIQHIREGMDVEIKTMSYPDEVFKGKISIVSQILDESAKVLKARIVLGNSSLKLKPGMLADIMVLKRTNGEAVSIPSSELIFSNDENYVVVYNGDCDLEVRRLGVLAMNNELVYVNDGLEENERVVSKNQLLIFNRINQ